jgi:hypothetical protein
MTHTEHHAPSEKQDSTTESAPSAASPNYFRKRSVGHDSWMEDDDSVHI